MNNIFFVFCLLFLMGCATTEKKIEVSSYSNNWSINTTYYISGEVNSLLNNNESKYNKTYIKIDLSPIVNNNLNSCNNIKYNKKNNIKLFFSSLSNLRESNYVFNNSEFWIISKTGKKYNLQAIDQESNRRIPYNTYNLSYPNNWNTNRYYYFKSPLICKDLEGAIFELKGIYKDGVELPPIKFRINYTNPSQVPLYNKDNKDN